MQAELVFSENEPAGHEEQNAEPLNPENLPASQGVQASA